MANRESISAALLALLVAANEASTTYQFQTLTRRPYPPGALSGSQLPAAMIWKVVEEIQRNQASGRGLGLTRYILHYTVMVYDLATTAKGSGQYDETRINGLLDLIDSAFTPTVYGERQTLGGLVQDAWIDGAVEIGQAVLDNHIVMAVPVHVLAGRLNVQGTP